MHEMSRKIKNEIVPNVFSSPPISGTVFVLSTEAMASETFLKSAVFSTWTVAFAQIPARRALAARSVDFVPDTQFVVAQVH